jgi:CubicO group peptidase (beta-lactamase class C family)
MVVARDGEPTWMGGVGLASPTTGAPMCAETLFRVASVSKLYVAALILRLVELNRLELTDTLAVLLPEVSEGIPGSERITVEHLLAHRSGLSSPDTADLGLQIDFIDRPSELAGLSLRERLARYVYRRPLEFEPGTGFRYSNTGYDLLGLIAERIEGESLQAALAHHFFDALELDQTSFELGNDPSIAHGHALTSEGWLLDVTVLDRANVGDESPSGGLITTAEELTVFLSALFGGRLISQASLDLMRRADCIDPNVCDRGYGLGFEWDARASPTAVGHSGNLVGVTARAYHFEETDTLVILMRNVKHAGALDMPFLRSVAD